jgi:CRP/FNR family transcriptional regulator, cyclic AMP receptor protein
MKLIHVGESSRKLARFLLEWASKYPGEKGQVRIKLTLTHEEIAQMIGSSRETVTRLLADFRKKQILQVMGSTLVIKNKQGLESIVNS